MLRTKHLIGLLFALGWASTAGAQGSFRALTPVPAEACPNSWVQVEYRVAPGILTQAQSLTLELSDASGSFASPWIIGQVDYQPGDTMGICNGIIPSVTPTGLGGYLFRFNASVAGIMSDVTPQAISIQAIAVPEMLIAGVTPLIDCPGDTITLQAQAGESFQWWFNGQPVALETNETFSTQGTGTAQCVVSINACRFFSNELVVSRYPAPVAMLDTLALPPQACFPQTISLPLGSGTPTGGTGYLDGEGIQGTDFNTVIAGTGSHLIHYIYEDANGCRDSASFRVNVPWPLFPTLWQDGMPVMGGELLCFRDSLSLAVNPTGSAVFWNGTQVSSPVTVSTPGSFSLEVQDSLGCRYSTDTVTLDQLPSLHRPAFVSITGSEITGAANAPNGSPIHLYVGDSLAGTSTVSGSAWRFTFTTALPIGTQVAVFYYGDGDCDGTFGEVNDITSDTIIGVVPFDDFPMVYPTAITPNGDGYNDELIFGATPLDREGGVWVESHPNARLQVFDRWGTRLVDIPNYENNWDGDDAPNGTYYYILDEGNGAEELRKTLTISR